MYKTIITVLLLIVGLINFIPIIGVLSTDHLAKLYGVNLTNNNIIILLQHRALMFGIIGAFIMYAGFNPSLQALAFIAGFVSMLGFIVFALRASTYNQELAKIITLDIIALVLLVIALALYIFKAP